MSYLPLGPVVKSRKYMAYKINYHYGHTSGSVRIYDYMSISEAESYHRRCGGYPSDVEVVSVTPD